MGNKMLQIKMIMHCFTVFGKTQNTMQIQMLQWIKKTSDLLAASTWQTQLWPNRLLTGPRCRVVRGAGHEWRRSETCQSTGRCRRRSRTGTYVWNQRHWNINNTCQTCLLEIVDTLKIVIILDVSVNLNLMNI